MMKIGNHDFNTAQDCYVMGILNCTPDSFSDGGRWTERDRALSHAEEMIRDGAAILDLGGESTRPGYTQISVQEETDRVVPVIEAVKARFDIPVSVEPYKSGVAAAALRAGADLVNDRWGLQDDPDGAALEQATVVRVVDGDTLVVSIDGREERVRLIGIDCPESVAPEPERNTPEGEDAAAFTKSLVKRGDAVWLERDENDVDQYGRLLRYVWLEEPASPDDAGEIGEKMLNGVLVREGYAQARRYGDDVAHASALEALGREASRAGRGVSGSWG